MAGSSIETLSREELYKLVWSEPITKLAPKFGLSDVGLAKVCRRYDIPRPHVGYWAQVAHGIEVEHADLPPIDDPELQEVRIFKKHFFGDERDTVPKKRIEVTVPDELTAPHPISRRVRSELRKTKQDQHGLKSVGSQSGFDVSVGNKSLPRAIRIIDAVIKAWLEEGGDVEKSQFKFGPNSVRVSLKEHVSRHEIKEKERTYWKEYRYELTGLLSFEIDGWARDRLRKTWKDGKVQRLENVLGSFIETLHEWMRSLDLRRIDDECSARQRRAAESRRERMVAKQQAEEKRRTELLGFVERWEKAERIRRFLGALAKRDATQVPPVPDSDYAKWIEWARWYADSLCPLVDTPPREESVEQPHNTEIADLDLTRDVGKVLRNLPIKDTNELYAMTKQDLAQACGSDDVYSIWIEVNRVLEGLGYDVSERTSPYGYR